MSTSLLALTTTEIAMIAVPLAIVLIIVLFWGQILVLWRKIRAWRDEYRGVHGSPIVDANFDCTGAKVEFELDQPTSDVPDDVYAVIWCNSGSPSGKNPAWLIPSGSIFPNPAHPKYRLENVPRDVTGSMCKAVVWCCYDVSGGPQDCKLGETTFKSCDAGSGSGFVEASKGGGGGSAVPMFRLAPQHYLLSVGQLLQGDEAWLRELAGGQPLKLAFQPDQSHGQSAVWSIQNGSAFTCELQVVKEGDSEPRADLTLASRANGSAANSVRWSTNYWSFTGINRLVAVQHTLESAYPQTVTVAPA